VTLAMGAKVADSALTIMAADTITINGPVTMAHDFSLTSSGGNITLASTVDGAHNLNLTASAGTITFNGAVGGTTPLSAVLVFNGIDVELNADIRATEFGTRASCHSSGPRVISADQIFIVNDGANFFGSIAGTGRLTLQPLTSGLGIDLGAASGSGPLVLTEADLSLITVGPSEATPTTGFTPGVLQIGGATAGKITISSSISFPFQTGSVPSAPNVAVLLLENNGTIVQDPGAGITVQQLAILGSGPVFLVADGQASAGNNIPFFAAHLTGATKDRTLVLNDSVQPNLNWLIDGLIGITPSARVNFSLNGTDQAIFAEQLAGQTYMRLPPRTPSGAAFSSNPSVDERVIVDRCGAGCVWTLGVEVPFSEEDGEQANPKGGSSY
jgi:hypothetical protein